MKSKLITYKIEQTNEHDIQVSRSRSSDGTRSISIKHPVIGKLTFSSDSFGDDYEMLAKSFADMLEQIADEPCLLPDAC